MALLSERAKIHEGERPEPEPEPAATEPDAEEADQGEDK